MSFLLDRNEQKNVREEFPILQQQKINGHPLVYLDSAATSLKPKRVIDRLSQFYLRESANVHRGAHFLSNQATTNFEKARDTVARFLGVEKSNEIIFTKGTTEGINLLARTLSEKLLPGDEILLSKMEHHSNIVPWQLIAQEKKLTIKFVDLCHDGSLNKDHFSQSMSPRTKIVSLTHCSNAIGTINPVAELFQIAKNQGAITVLDGAQSVPQMPVDIKNLNSDFLVFSGHKALAPNGVGVLWGKDEILNELRPYQSGGSMIDTVTLEGSTFLMSPHRFEAGTPPIGEVIALGESLKFLEEIGRQRIHQHETYLAELARKQLQELPHIRFFGESPRRGNIVSFIFSTIHSSDIGSILDQEGIAVRTGHHCTQPLMNFFGISGTIRASFSIYNNEEDVYRFISATKKALEFFI